MDKDINLWFHTNSFRGVTKEKVILYEMTDKILNARPTLILSVQKKLCEVLQNDDIFLQINKKYKAISVRSKNDQSQQYRFIFLDNLYPSYNYIDFDYDTCTHICNTLIDILRTYPDHSMEAVSKPLEDKNTPNTGIYHAINRAEPNGYAYVTVSWENQIYQDLDNFEQQLRTVITRIAEENQWKDIPNNSNYAKPLSHANDFDSLLEQIAKITNDPKWLYHHDDERIYKGLKRIFFSKRDKDDTDKAIYRLCCIGLVEDVTIDYLSESYELKVKNRSDEDLKQYMLDFFLKYYS